MLDGTEADVASRDLTVKTWDHHVNSPHKWVHINSIVNSQHADGSVDDCLQGAAIGAWFYVAMP